MNISVYIPDEEILEKLKRIADKEQRSVSYIITQILIKYLSKDKK